jgi:hypothetical protein
MATQEEEVSLQEEVSLEVWSRSAARSSLLATRLGHMQQCLVPRGVQYGGANRPRMKLNGTRTGQDDHSRKQPNFENKKCKDQTYWLNLETGKVDDSDSRFGNVKPANLVKLSSRMQE